MSAFVHNSTWVLISPQVVHNVRQDPARMINTLLSHGSGDRRRAGRCGTGVHRLVAAGQWPLRRADTMRVNNAVDPVKG
jgi:hypothetical protein